MRRRALAVVAVAATLAQPRASRPAPAQSATALLARCLATPDRPFPPDAQVVTPPPGLTQRKDLEVAKAPNGGSGLFLFRGTGEDVACGVALYGPVNARTQDELDALLDHHPGWSRRTPPATPVGAVTPLRQLYWVDDHAPGLGGASMAVRPARSDAPTIEIAVYHKLVR